MMISNKQEEKDPGTLRRVSLLSRASSNIVSNNRQSRTSIVANKNYDRSSKLLNLYLGPQQTSNRDSCFYMAGIDEKEEYDETSHGTNNSSRMGGTLVSSSRASHVKKYDFQSHYTPS
jgi:hypothetical protein